MKKKIATLFLFLAGRGLAAQNRFPKPDFESGYTYPDHSYPVPNEAFWTTLDILLLVVMMSMVAWAVIKKRQRKPIVWISLLSVAYFGFFRSGCVCSIGAIQNVSLALADPGYVMPLSVLLFFILPVLFAFLFGRVFCAGVCPLGALQEIVNVKNYRLSKVVTTLLGMIPWIYLIVAILYAVTRSSFIICRFDPFIGIFRLGGNIGLITFGVLLLVAAVFTGRPFCRFICPYGALLSLFSRVSLWRPALTQKKCINCELCHNACPVDAIMPPYENRVKESRTRGVHRILIYLTVLPLLAIAGALLMNLASDSLSQGNKEVRLYGMVMEQETNPQDRLSPELEAFYGQGGTIESLREKAENTIQEFKLYGTIAGALIGLVIGFSLIGLSVKRTRKTYEINGTTCVSCARCFSYCPQNQKDKK